MKRYEKILEKLTCPCGGEVIVVTGDPPTKKALWCKETFDGTGDRNSLIDALIAWLVLTGGPIDGSVEPPHGIRVIGKPCVAKVDDCKSAFDGGWRYSDGWNPADCWEEPSTSRPVKWAFYPEERTEPVLRPWLEEDV